MKYSLTELAAPAVIGMIGFFSFGMLMAIPTPDHQQILDRKQQNIGYCRALSMEVVADTVCISPKDSTFLIIPQ